MQSKSFRAAVVVATLVAGSASAVTYVVPRDRDLVRQADAIVIATALESHPVATGSGGIATVTTFVANDVLKGAVSNLEVREPGGSIDGRMMFVPGAPRFNDGARYLLFLHGTASGTFTTEGLALGKFDFTSDVRGREVVARGSLESAIGWDAEGAPYVERLRDAAAFLDFVRTVAKNPDAPAAESYGLPSGETFAHLVLRPAPTATRADYLFSTKVRWNNNATATFNYCCAPNLQPAPFDGPGAASTAAAQWNGTGVIHYTLGGVTTANKGLTQSDGNNGILFNDPNNELAAFGSGVVALGGFTSTGSTYSLGGETFIDITEADIVVGKNAQFPSGVSQALFAAVLTHEMGHTLGFRHANGTGDPSSPPPNCAAPSPCSSGGQAIMESVVARTTLGSWDSDAAQTVYGAGPVCNNPAITGQPQSTNITAGGGTTLSVTATGTNPTYQWFQGNPGSGSAIGGATSSTLFVSPGSTTTYYVVVTACATSVTSNAATVTVTCNAPSITSQPQSQSILQGSSTSLSVGATGSNVTYQWYIGNQGNTSSPVPGGTIASISVSPPTTTNYWVRVTACATSVDSNTVTVTVGPCTAPSITTQPQSTSVQSGQSTTLSVTAAGTNLTYQWYTGTSGNTTQLIAGATQRTLTVSPTTATSYWVRVSGACGTPVDSATAVVSIGVACSVTVSGVTANPKPALPAQTITLSVTATTTSGTLSYQWFRGALNDTSNPIGTGPSITVTQTTTSNYWVRATSSCGTSASGEVNVPLNTGACGSNANQLCLNNARYRVTLSAGDPAGKTGQGVALYQSNVFGYFSLPTFTGDSGNPEVFVKIVEPSPGNPWVFYAGLTNLDYTISVVDTQGSFNRSYHVAPPPPGSFQNFGNFDVFGSTSSQCSNVTTTSSAGSPGACSNTAGAICLLNRFSITLQAKDNPSRTNNTGTGAAVPVNSVFGFFTVPALSPDPSDIQVFVKMVDARSFDGHIWVFLGGLTDFDFTLTVRDTLTGVSKIYNKPAGSTCGLNDTQAF